jgi:hypothetical protein
MIARLRSVKILTLFTLFLASTGCNLFGFIDQPSGDQQLLAAARGCLDEGNFDCARDYYNQISSLYEDTKQSELSFTDLAEEGLTIGAFVEAFSTTQNSGTGATITVLANDLVPASGEALRTKFYDAWARQSLIGDADLQALVRFMASTALLASIYAEEASVAASTASFSVADYANTGTCVLGLTCAVSFADCAPAAGSDFNNFVGAGLVDMATAPRSAFVGTIDATMTFAVSKEISDALDQLSAGGIFGDASNFGDAFSVEPTDANTRNVFMCEVRQQGIGD